MNNVEVVRAVERITRPRLLQVGGGLEEMDDSPGGDGGDDISSFNALFVWMVLAGKEVSGFRGTLCRSLGG